MSTDERPIAWRGFDASVTGASHVRANPNRPPEDLNQDAVKTQHGAGSVVAAIADGHGSALYFRSALGAKIAADVAVSVLGEFMSREDISGGVLNEDSLGRILDDARSELPKRLCTEWRQRVLADHDSNPWSDDEQDALLHAEGRRWAEDDENLPESPYIAYGTTLLAVAVTETLVLYIQIGDGDIVRLESEWALGGPLADDERLIGNETTSLCLPKAWLDFRINAERLASDTPGPVMVLLGTDGWKNSFKENSFDEFSTGLLRQAFETGIGSVEADLGGWLQLMTEGGAGDDTTLAVLHRHPLPERTEAPPPVAPENAETADVGSAVQTPDERREGRHVVTVPRPDDSPQRPSRIDALTDTPATPQSDDSAKDSEA